MVVAEARDEIDAMMPRIAKTGTTRRKEGRRGAYFLLLGKQKERCWEQIHDFKQHLCSSQKSRFPRKLLTGAAIPRPKRDTDAEVWKEGRKEGRKEGLW